MPELSAETTPPAERTGTDVDRSVPDRGVPIRPCSDGSASSDGLTTPSPRFSSPSPTSAPENEQPAESDLAACRDLLRGGSRTFFAASFLLPRRVRDAATALYAFCRLADDAVDLAGNADAALADLRDRLSHAYEGRPRPIAADRAFAAMVAGHGVPYEAPAALLEGFEWDSRGRRYDDLSDVVAYGVRVAGTVGAMMTVLMGRRAPATVARACDLGIAMQLTNIARDVGEDARAGRLYLPMRWLRDEGIDPDRWLADPVFDASLGRVVQRLLAAADAFYARAEAGIAGLPVGCRPGIRAARLLYAEIGREVERQGCDSVSRRARVSGRRKARLLARALAPLPGELVPCDADAACEARFLVEAIAAVEVPASSTRIPAPKVRDRFVWVIELFERLERAQRAAASGPAPASEG